MKVSMMFVALSIVSSVSAEAQLVPDLTGTWQGKWTCKSFDGVKFNEGNKTSTLQITQLSTTTFAADLDNGDFHYNGALIPAVKNTADKAGKAEAIMNQCPTDNLPLAGNEGEIIRVSVKTKPNDFKASLKGLSIFENGDPSLGTCKYSFKRKSPTGQTIAACP